MDTDFRQIKHFTIVEHWTLVCPIGKTLTNPINLIYLLCTGMFQRLDKLRKNAFASVILFGSTNDSSISGIWVFRGQKLAFEVSMSGF